MEKMVHTAKHTAFAGPELWLVVGAGWRRGAYGTKDTVVASLALVGSSVEDRAVWHQTHSTVQ